MTQRQDNKLVMLMILRDYLIQYNAIVLTIPNLNGLLTNLQTLINQIQSVSVSQISNKTGVKENKEELRNNVVVIGGDVARRLSAYATIANNDILFQEVHVSDAELLKLTDERLRDTIQLIYDRGMANMTTASAYGINSFLLSSLLSALNAYNVAMPKPRLSITEKRQATILMAKLFDDVDALLMKIDILVDIVKLTQTSFHSGFKSARVLIDRGGRKRMLTMFVIDLLDGTPIKGVTCKFTLETHEIVKKSSVKGGFFIKSMPEGVYKLRANKSGYKELVRDVAVVKNESSRLTISIGKI